MKKIIILGSNGMLGQMVHLFFVRMGFHVTCYDERFSEDTYIDYFNFLNSQDSSIIINCIGRIKQKSIDAMSLLLSNSVLPLELARNLRADHILVHPSTDCVFNGISKFKYAINSFHNANDIYGWSKSLGEKAILSRENSVIIRVSIIGPDKNTNSGLFAWFLGLPIKSKIKGYNNHYWNGITTLEWCKQLLLIFKMIDFEKPFESKVFQLGTNIVYSKYEMLNLFQNIFDTQHSIENYSCDEPINRSLISDFELIELDQQLVELKKFIS
jgi:dTDP-4-dehydrorhamnose reductase